MIEIAFTNHCWIFINGQRLTIASRTNHICRFGIVVIGLSLIGSGLAENRDY